MSPPVVDRSKPLKEQYKQLQIANGIIPPPVEPEAAPAEPDNKKDCSIEEGCDDDPPFDVEEPSETTSQSSSAEILMPEEAGEIFKHKLGEAVLPLRLLLKFIGMYPPGAAHRVSQLAGKFGEPVNDMRHVLIYDSYENLKKYER
jgi:hypothetical protein